jgi:hypothetical protein
MINDPVGFFINDDYEEDIPNTESEQEAGVEE